MPVRKDFIKETNENTGHSNLRNSMRKVLNVRMHYHMEQQVAAGERMFRNTGGVMVGKEVQNDI